MTIRSCCCPRSSLMSRSSTRRWRTVPVMCGSDVNASSRPWPMRPRRPSLRWKSCTTATCSTIPCSRPVPCPVSTSQRSRSPPTAAGRCRSPTIIQQISNTLPNTPGSPPRQRVLRVISSNTSMSAVQPEATFRDEELLAEVIARIIGDVRHVAVGNASPIPATAALLARARGNGLPYVSLLQSRKHNFFTDGGRELFDCAGQGRVDVFFLSGGEIDGEANINLVSIGDYDHPKVRFPGSFGAAYLYYVVPKLILFRTEHSRRTLVPKVSFISAPGSSVDNVYRPGGPIALVTNRCLFSFDHARRRFSLASVHPGHSVEEIIEHTGFDFDRPDDVPTTVPPSQDTLRLMREVVAPQLAEVYPQFAATVFGASSAHSR